MKKQNALTSLLLASTLCVTSVFSLTAAEEATEAVTEVAIEEETEAATEEVMEVVTEAAGEAATEGATEATTQTVTAEAAEEAAVEAEAEEAEAEPAVYVYEDENIKLGEYKGLTYSASVYEVTDEDVDIEIEDTLEGYATYEQVKEGVAQEGDTVNIDYTGTMDGEEFAGGSDTDTEITLGAGMFLEEFETGIVGMAVGETKDVPFTFPEDYNPEVAGKEVTFAITLNYICGEEIIPELTDEWVKEEMGYDTIEEYRASVKASMQEEEQSMFEGDVREELLTELMQRCEVAEVPQDRLEELINSQQSYYQYYASMFGMEFDAFLAQFMGMDSAQFTEVLTTDMTNYLKQCLVLDKIAELEELEVSEEDYEAYLNGLVADYGYESLEALKEEIAASEGLEDDLRKELLEEAAYQFIFENAVYVEPSEEDMEEWEVFADEEMGDEEFEELTDEEVLNLEDEDWEEIGEEVIEGEILEEEAEQAQEEAEEGAEEENEVG